MIDPQHYTYRVIWSEDDKEYLALCTEFPSVSFLAEDSDKANAGIRKLVSEIVEDTVQNGEKVPQSSL